jgi:exonuclease III
MNDNEIKIAAFQETKLSEKSKLSDMTDYTLLRNDREKDSGGGLAFLVHKSILFQKLPTPRKDPHLEYQGIKVGNLNIHNIYVPPASSCAPGYTPSLTPYLQTRDSIICGDINAHDDLWFSRGRHSYGKD